MAGLNLFNLRALDTTVTEERLIAAAANMGLKRRPIKGYKTPAARGMREVL